jgi:hypothetical protein
MVMSIATGDVHRPCIRCGGRRFAVIAAAPRFDFEMRRVGNQIHRKSQVVEPVLRSRELFMVSSADGSDI